jgi:hypothetical protein
MSADSKNSDRRWSYHLWLMQRKTPPPAKFSKEHTKTTKEEKFCLNFNNCS